MRGQLDSGDTGKGIKSRILQTNWAKCSKEVYVKMKYPNKMQIRKEKTWIINSNTGYGLYQEDTIN